MNNSPVLLDLRIMITSGFSYRLAGNTRAGNSTASGDVLCITEDARIGSVVRLNKGQVLKIRKARLLPTSCPGLDAGSFGGFYAGEFKMIQGTRSGSDITRTPDTDSALLRFIKFGEWEDKDFEMEFAVDKSSLGIGTGSYVSVNDFNVQEDWVGEDVMFEIEAQAELYIGD